MESFLDDWGLSLAVFLPLAGALLMLLIPREREDLHKGVALLTSLLVLAVGVGVAAYFSYDNGGTLQYVIDETWISFINSRYIIGIDGISLPLMLLTMLVVPACVVYCFGHFPEPRNPKAFLILILVLET